MKMSRAWIVLSLVLVFAAGVVGGIFVDRSSLVRRQPARGGDHRPAPPPSDRWMKELGLSIEQQERMREVFRRNDERVKGLRADFYKHLGEIREQLKKDIDEVLTPEQKKKLEDMIQKHMEERRRDNERREGNVKPRPKDQPSMGVKEKIDEKAASNRLGDSRDRRRSHPGLRPDQKRQGGRAQV